MIDQWILKFKKNALPSIMKEFEPNKVIMFGSRVNGTAKRNSDLDIILVSDYFVNIPFLKRMSIALKKIAFPKHIDYLCYTPKEYKKIKNESSIIMDALKNSMEIVI
ncbi:MAG: nucleotidyltransferase domain-containing protein [Elusimicrobiota bacterium]